MRLHKPGMPGFFPAPEKPKPRPKPGFCTLFCSQVARSRISRQAAIRKVSSLLALMVSLCSQAEACRVVACPRCRLHLVAPSKPGTPIRCTPTAELNRTQPVSPLLSSSLIRSRINCRPWPSGNISGWSLCRARPPEVDAHLVEVRGNRTPFPTHVKSRGFTTMNTV